MPVLISSFERILPVFAVLPWKPAVTNRAGKDVVQQKDVVYQQQMGKSNALACRLSGALAA